MKCYTYFPGCSASHGGAAAYDKSARAVAKSLNVELIELEDWNCCGSSPYSSVDELASLCCSARNLSLAEKKGLDMVTPCSACYVILNRTNMALKEYPHIKFRVDEALSAGSLEYRVNTRVRHLLDVFANDISPEQIVACVKKDLSGLKVAPYYGCQVVRPGPGFDHPEFPQSLDRLIQNLGAEATFFPLKSRCCGGSLIISEEDLALELIYKLLDNASSNGAQCIATVCPLCQTNLDAYQGRVNKKFKTKFKLPVLFFTQLMGFAFGLEEEDLGLEKCIVTAKEIFSKPVGAL
jgi:heterodisulfide reductase subunit B